MSTTKPNTIESEIVPSSPSQQQQRHQPTSRSHSRSGSVSNTSIRHNTHSRTNSGSMPKPSYRAEAGGYATTTTDDDDSVIRCICNFEHDDGFTIQCERCLVWQHAVCVGIDQDSVPDEYLCERCAPRELDAKKAVEKQKRGGGGGLDKGRSRSSPKRRQNSKSGGSRKGSTIAGDGNAIQSPTGAFPWDLASGAGIGSVGTAPKEQRDFTSSGAGSGGSGIGGTGSGKKGTFRKSRKGPDRLQFIRPLSGSQSGQFHPLMNDVDDENWGDVGDQEDDEYDDEETPAYELEFSSIGSNIIASGQVHDLFRQVSELVRSQSDAAKSSLSSTTGVKLEDSDGKISPTDMDLDVDEGARKFDVDLESLIPITYNSLKRPSARVSVRRVTKTSERPTSFTHNEDTSPPLEPTNAGSRYGLFAESNIGAGRFILELKGEQILKSSYIRDPINQYPLLGTPKPHVFFPSGSLDLCVDARRFGNVARFVRNSCHPNAEIRGMYVAGISEEDEDSEDDREDRDDEFGTLPTVHLGLYAKRDVARGEEVTIGWDWAPGHPALEPEPKFEEGDTLHAFGGSDEEDSVRDKTMDDDKDSILTLKKKEWTRRRSRAVKPILAVSSCACASLWSVQCKIRNMACGEDDSQESRHDFANGRRITKEQKKRKKRGDGRTTKSHAGNGKGPPHESTTDLVQEEGLRKFSVAETVFARRRRSSTGSQLDRSGSRMAVPPSSDIESGDEEVDGGILGDDNVSENDAKSASGYRKRGGAKTRRRRTRRVTTGGMDNTVSESEQEEGSDRENVGTTAAESAEGGGEETATKQDRQPTESRRPSKSRYGGGRIGIKELDSIIMAPPPAPPPPPPPPPTSSEEPNRPLSREERKLKETLARIAKMEEREESGRKKKAGTVVRSGAGKSAKTKDSKENDNEKEGGRRGRIRSSESRTDFPEDVKTEGKLTPRKRKETFDRRRRDDEKMEGSEEEEEEEEEENGKKDVDEEMEDAEPEEDERVDGSMETGRRRRRNVSGASSSVGKRNERKKGIASPAGKNAKTSIADGSAGAGGTLSSSSLSSVSGMSSSEDDEEPGDEVQFEDRELEKAEARRTGRRRGDKTMGGRTQKGGTAATRNPRNRRTSGDVGRKQGGAGTSKRKRTYTSPTEGDDLDESKENDVGKKGDESNTRRTRRPSLRNLPARTRTRTRTRSSPASAPTSTPVSTPGSSSAGEDDEGTKKSTRKRDRAETGGGRGKARSSNGPRSNARPNSMVELHGGKKFWQRKWMTTRSPFPGDASGSTAAVAPDGHNANSTVDQESFIKGEESGIFPSSSAGTKRALGGEENGSAMISGRKKAKLDDEPDGLKRESSASSPQVVAEPRRLSLRDYQVEKGLLPAKGTGLAIIVEGVPVTDASMQRTVSTDNTPEKEVRQGTSESARTTPDNEKPKKLSLSDYRKQKQLEAAAKKESGGDDRRFDGPADARRTTGLDFVLPESPRSILPNLPSPRTQLANERKKGDDMSKSDGEYFPIVSLPDHLLPTLIGKEMASHLPSSTFDASPSGKLSEDYFPVLPMSSVLRTGSEKDVKEMGRIRPDDDRSRGVVSNGNFFKPKEVVGARDRDRDGREWDRDRTGRDVRDREREADGNRGRENKEHGNRMTMTPPSPSTSASPQPPRGPSSGFPFVPCGGQQQVGARNGLVRNRRYVPESGTSSPPPKGPAVSAPYDPANPDGGDVRRSPPTPTGPAADRERERERDRERDRDMGGIRDVRDRNFQTDRFADRPPPFGTSRSSSNNGAGAVGAYKHPLDSTMPSYYGGPSYRDRRDYGYPSPREGYDQDTGRYPPRKANMYASSPLSAAPSNIPFQGTGSSGRAGGGGSGTSSYNNGSASGSGGVHGEGRVGGGGNGVERRFNNNNNDDEDANGIPTGPRKPRFYTPSTGVSAPPNSSTNASSSSSLPMGPGQSFGSSGTGTGMGNSSSSTAGRSDTVASGSANGGAGGKTDDYPRRDRR